MRPAVPLQEDPGALVAQQPQLRAAVGGRAVVGNLQLDPARPVLRQEEIVREVGGVGHDERVGGEELRRGDRARARHIAAAEAAPAMVSVAPVSAPVAAKLAAVAAPEAVNVPVDTSPAVVKFPALAVLLMVNVLPVIPVAELSRPTLAAPGACGRQRGSGDGAGGCERSAGDCARGVHARREHVRAVHVVAQQLVAAHVALRGEPVQRGQAREATDVRQQVRHGDRLAPPDNAPTPSPGSLHPRAPGRP